MYYYTVSKSDYGTFSIRFMNPCFFILKKGETYAKKQTTANDFCINDSYYNCPLLCIL